MTTQLLLAFAVFAFVTTITPGPNNMMLLASGLNFGLRRSLPHMLGISIGLALLVAAVGFGLGELFERQPMLYRLLRYLGGAYLLYLAWKIAWAGKPSGNGQQADQPFSFFQAAAFQWINPKAWVMAIGAITTYAPAENFTANVLLIAVLFGLISSPCIGIWTLAGSLLRESFNKPRLLRGFNLSMALLLVASLYPLFNSIGVH